jgi:hypothetical protein
LTECSIGDVITKAAIGFKLGFIKKLVGSALVREGGMGQGVALDVVGQGAGKGALQLDQRGGRRSIGVSDLPYGIVHEAAAERIGFIGNGAEICEVELHFTTEIDAGHANSVGEVAETVFRISGRVTEDDVAAATLDQRVEAQVFQMPAVG